MKLSSITPDVVAANDREAAEDAPSAAADTDDQDKQTSRSSGTAKRRKQASSPAKKVASQSSSQERKSKPKPEPEPVLEPELQVRAAAKADIGAIGRLIGSKSAVPDLAARLDELKRGGGGVLVADRGGVIGCVAWHTILSLQAVPIGRITTLMVVEDQRRHGIGRALIEAALSAMVEQGCATLEAMSDIEVRSTTGFYRALGFDQASYRFVRLACQ